MKLSLVLFTLLFIKFSIICVEADKEIEAQTASRWDDEVWKDIPGQYFARFYVYNVTNANQYNLTRSPAKPIVQEVGPYVYLMKREKFNVSELLLDGSFYFREKKTYEFQAHLSEGRSEDDLVNVVNTALITCGWRTVLSSNYMADYNFRDLMASGEELILKNQLISDVLFNGRNASTYVKYEKDLGSSGTPPGFEAFADGRYGLLKGINGSHSGLLRVKPRAANENVGQIISWNDESVLNVWNGEVCNKIKGTDGSIFGPKISESTEIDLSVFLTELSRSVPLTFKESIQLGGVIGKRYKFADSFLEDSEMREENQCFCTDSYSRCLRRGALDMQTTKMGAPYVLSNAHFIRSDGTYPNRVDGFLPAPTIHESFYDVEPITGTVLKYKKRFQWNIRVGPIYGGSTNLTYFRTIPEYLFPIFWMEESFQLDGDIVVGLKRKLKDDDDFETTSTEATTLTTTTDRQTITTGIPTTDRQIITTGIPTTTTTTATTVSNPTTKNLPNTERPGIEKECPQSTDDRWIKNSLNLINIYLIILTLLVCVSVIACAISVGLLLINVRGTSSILRVIKGNGSFSDNNIQSNFSTVTEKEKI